MTTTRLVTWAFAVTAAACTTEVVSAPPAPTNEDEGCSETLCLSEDAQASLTEAKQALATCVPDDAAISGDPSGLRISELSIAGSEGELVSLRVVLANTLPEGVMTYPGSTLRVVAGDGVVPGPTTGQLYGIFGCDEVETIFTVEWDGTAPLTLAAAATNELGESTIHEVELTLQP